VLVERVVSQAFERGEDHSDAPLLAIVHRRARPHVGDHAVSSFDAGRGDGHAPARW
jgi:hypothetical protein